MRFKVSWPRSTDYSAGKARVSTTYRSRPVLEPMGQLDSVTLHPKTQSGELMVTIEVMITVQVSCSQGGRRSKSKSTPCTDHLIKWRNIPPELEDSSLYTFYSRNIVFVLITPEDMGVLSSQFRSLGPIFS